MTTAAQTRAIMAHLQIKNTANASTRYGLASVFSFIKGAICAADLPYQLICVGVEGIAYALGTGRLHGAADIAVRRCTPRQLVSLIVEAGTACPTMGDVPRRLNACFPVAA